MLLMCSKLQWQLSHLEKEDKITVNSRGNSTSESTQVIHNVHHLNLGCHSTCGYLLLLLLFLLQNKFSLSMPGHFQRLFKSTIGQIVKEF
jgi:hypothetical protein